MNESCHARMSHVTLYLSHINESCQQKDCIVGGAAFALSISIFLSTTEWPKCIECFKLQVSFRKRATNYRALFRNMSYKDEASYASSPPCMPYVPTPPPLSNMNCILTYTCSHFRGNNEVVHAGLVGVGLVGVCCVWYIFAGVCCVWCILVGVCCVWYSFVGVCCVSCILLGLWCGSRTYTVWLFSLKVQHLRNPWNRETKRFLGSRSTTSNRDLAYFEFYQEFEFLDLVSFGGVAFSLEFVVGMCCGTRGSRRSVLWSRMSVLRVMSGRSVFCVMSGRSVLCVMSRQSVLCAVCAGLVGVCWE